MALVDYRVDANECNHPKIKRLVRGGHFDRYFSLHSLYGFVRFNRPDGNLAGMEDDAIAAASNWDKDEKEWVSILVRFGFLDGEPGNYQLHDWADHNRYALHQHSRSEKARKGAAARWGATTSDKQAMLGALPESEISNAPSPSPSPSPSPEEKEKTRAREEVRPVSEIPPTKEQIAQIEATKHWDHCWICDPVTRQPDPTKGKYLEARKGERAARDEICAALDHDVGKIKSMIERFFFEDDDEWIQDKRNWHTFKRKVNEYRESNGSGKRKGNDKRAIAPASDWKGKSGPVTI